MNFINILLNTIAYPEFMQTANYRVSNWPRYPKHKLVESSTTPQNIAPKHHEKSHPQINWQHGLKFLLRNIAKLWLHLSLTP